MHLVSNTRQRGRGRGDEGQLSKSYNIVYTAQATSVMSYMCILAGTYIVVYVVRVCI